MQSDFIYVAWLVTRANNVTLGGKAKKIFKI